MYDYLIIFIYICRVEQLRYVSAKCVPFLDTTKNKVMEKTENASILNVKKTICLTPANSQSELQINALRVLNEFRLRGFVVWPEFLAEVLREYPELDSARGFRSLQAFWHNRNYDADLIEKLEVLADNLKEEA